MFDACDEGASWLDGERDDAREAFARPAAIPPGRQSVKLSDLLDRARFVACDDIIAGGCHDDPTACRPGDVFVLRMDCPGEGQDLVAMAIARGVSGIISEQMIPTFGTPLCIVPDAAWALGRLAHACAGDPARRLKLIAITGTSGKTTAAWLAASVLSEAGLRVGVLSDLGCLDADATEPVAADLGQPGVLAVWLSRLVESGCTHAVVEVSSRMLADHVLAGVSCDTVVVTNLAVAHLDCHGTAEAYHTIKARILDTLGADGCLVANVDDGRVRALADRHAAGRAGRVMRVGLQRSAEIGVDISAIPVERSLFGQMVLVQADGHVSPLSLATPVASFVRDALFATAVGLRQRMPLERVTRGIEAAGSISGRMERLDRGQDAAVFLDRPTSGHSLATSLSSLRRLTPGRLVVVAERSLANDLGGRRFGRRAARWSDETLVVPASILDEAAEASGNSKALVAYARFDRLMASLGAGDCLLVLGDIRGSEGGPDDSGEPQASLVALVDGWLQLAHPPVWAQDRRAA